MDYMKQSLKRKLSVSIWKKDVPSKDLLKNMVFPKQVYISNWVSQFRKECQTNEEASADYGYMKENLRLRK